MENTVERDTMIYKQCSLGREEMSTCGDSARLARSILLRPHAIIVCRTKAEIEAVRKNSDGLHPCTGHVHTRVTRIYWHGKRPLITAKLASAHLDWLDFKVQGNQGENEALHPGPGCQSKSWGSDTAKTRLQVLYEIIENAKAFRIFAVLDVHQRTNLRRLPSRQ